MTRGIATRLLEGSGACFREKKILMVQFGVYFHNFFLLSKSLKISFLYKNSYKNCSPVLARGSRSMVHSPLIIFIKGGNL